MDLAARRGGVVVLLGDAGAGKLAAGARFAEGEIAEIAEIAGVEGVSRPAHRS